MWKEKNKVRSKFRYQFINDLLCDLWYDTIATTEIACFLISVIVWEQVRKYKVV